VVTLATSLVMGAECQGDYTVPSSLVCVLMVYPGQPCSPSAVSSIPLCGTQDCSNGRCVGGSVGDICSIDADCLSENSTTMGKCGISESLLILLVSVGCVWSSS